MERRRHLEARAGTVWNCEEDLGFPYPRELSPSAEAKGLRARSPSKQGELAEFGFKDGLAFVLCGLFEPSPNIGSWITRLFDHALPDEIRTVTLLLRHRLAARMRRASAT